MTSDEYIGSLGECFLALRPKGLVLDPTEYMLLKRWEADRIPYWLAVRTITEVMGRFLESRERDKRANPERITRTVPLSYLDRPVREAWAEVITLQTPAIAKPLDKRRSDVQ